MKCFPEPFIFELLSLDLSDLFSVCGTAETIIAKQDRLEGPVNNAVVLNNTYNLSKDEYKHRFDVNSIVQFLITELLSDMLKKSISQCVICFLIVCTNGF